MLLRLCFHWQTGSLPRFHSARDIDRLDKSIINQYRSGLARPVAGPTDQVNGFVFLDIVETLRKFLKWNAASAVGMTGAILFRRANIDKL